MYAYYDMDGNFVSSCTKIYSLTWLESGHNVIFAVRVERDKERHQICPATEWTETFVSLCFEQ